MATSKMSISEQKAPKGKEGYLMKRGGFVKNWKKRYFMVRNGEHLVFAFWFANSIMAHGCNGIQMNQESYFTW